MAEKTLVNRILADLRANGAVAEKIHGGPYQSAGIADIVGCFPVLSPLPSGRLGVYLGLFLAIECKDGAKVRGAAGDPTAIQAYFLKQVNDRGGLSYVVKTRAEWDALLVELLELRRELVGG